ncbi:MAG: hypothetical protein AB1757_14765 [Acidobacteriota bacterium]
MRTEAERYDTSHPHLCPMLRWKAMFYDAPRDPEIPHGLNGHFWCLFTQSCLGPDGQLAEPGECNSADRPCHGTGKI